MKINVVTRCSRVNNLNIIKKSIFDNIENYEIVWHIIFDTDRANSIDINILKLISDERIKTYFMQNKNDMMHGALNTVIDTFQNDSWVYVLDDDNILHPDFYKTIRANEKSINNYKIVIVSQDVNFKDFANIKTREAKPNNTVVGKVDMGQLLIKSEVFNNYKISEKYTGDGIFVEKIFKEHREWIKWIPIVASYYNYLDNPRKHIAPKILYIGDSKPELKSHKYYESEADDLDVVYLQDDDNIFEIFNNFKPDVIVTVGHTWDYYEKLSLLPINVRSKWVHFDNVDNIENLGEQVYNNAMFNILGSVDNSKLISFVTPIYNTGYNLYDVYNSLLSQTYPYWEWIIINDSTDNGFTLKIANSLAANDSRIVVYDFSNKTNGNIGEAKHRGFSLANGYLLAELDHDDILTSNCALDLYNASKKYPECGFFYGDSAEIDANHNSLSYPDGFCFGYGKYREEMYNNITYKVNIQPNINPKTIRHIVGVPNHIRAWRKNIYSEIGGHNRNLNIADDYELLVRTFLHTMFCKIPTLTYLQRMGKSNAQDIGRADIQRRVRSIMYYYNEQINNRFKELNLIDWAYDENKNDPLSVESKFEDEEQIANVIYDKIN